MQCMGRGPSTDLFRLQKRDAARVSGFNLCFRTIIRMGVDSVVVFEEGKNDFVLEMLLAGATNWRFYRIDTSYCNSFCLMDYMAIS